LENTSVSQRVATVTVSVSGLPNQTVTVTQAGAALVLTLGPANQNVSSSAGTTLFNVTSNTNWTASSNAAWCTVNPSGSGNGTITASYTTNLETSVRVATITTTVSGLPPQTVTVTQAASTVGIHDAVLTDLQVYPNPTNGVFSVKSGSLKYKALEVSVMDISGKKILSRTCSGMDEYRFDISQETKGIYFIRINSDNSTQVRRIILID
jgi:hypothetical protein